MDWLNKCIAVTAAGFALVAAAFLALVAWVGFVQWVVGDSPQAALLDSHSELYFAIWRFMADEAGGWRGAGFWLMNYSAASAVLGITGWAFRKTLALMRGESGDRCDKCGRERFEKGFAPEEVVKKWPADKDG